MAWIRNRYRKKRRYKKKKTGKAKRLIRYKQPNPLQVYRTKIECFQPLFNSTAGIISQGLNYYLYHPAFQKNALGTFGAFAAGQIASELPRLEVLFQEYMVEKLVLRYFPSYQNITPPPNATEIPYVAYVYNDTSNDNIVPTEIAALTSGCKPRMIDMAKTFTHTMYVPRGNLKWIPVNLRGTAPAAVPGSQGAVLANTAIDDPWACIKTFFPNVQISSYYGRVFLTWYVRYRNPTTAS